MTGPGEEMQPIGTFEPRDAKRVIGMVEAQESPFELQADDSALSNLNRSVQPHLGMYPEGSKIVVLEPDARVSMTTEALKGLFAV